MKIAFPILNGWIERRIAQYRLSSGQNPEECDARNDDSSNTVWLKIILAIMLLFVSFFSYSQSPKIDEEINTANDLYKQQQYEQAAKQYQKVLEIDSTSTTAKFNLGNSLYKKNSRNEAIKAFGDLAANTQEKELRSKSYYNKGVVLTKQQKLEESIEAYKDALRQNPDDKDARENLQKALLELKKREPPKKEPEKKKQQQKQPQSKMSPKEAEQRLKLMEQKEKEVQERLQKAKSQTGGNQVKDW